MLRIVTEEILDRLPPDDPEAVRSRADLRRINFLMGNSRWILRQVARHRAVAEKGIVELGAGEGVLLRRLSEFGPATGIDLVPRPPGLAETIAWQVGDALAADRSGGILVANLFLHHFEGEALAALGNLARNFELLVAVEPFRSPRALQLGRGMNAFVGPVTRHDMEASIRAGFRIGELAPALGLGRWRFSERTSWRGGLRVLAWRDA
ncbi:class I SAM-dependent methyltransferase [Haloferula sargassicola]|uniref:Methyltransferase domain-containing protein n=1 Tax=Haloferula sargassicola TaxID=490096 RepID=A0ABP9UN40_9BACT